MNRQGQKGVVGRHAFSRDSVSWTSSLRQGTSIETVSKIEKFGIATEVCSVIAFITGPTGLCGATGSRCAWARWATPW